MLPLQTEHIEAWFSFIFNDKERPLRWESFCKRVAALRYFSRSHGYFDLDHLNYNVQKSKSKFCSYMRGLKQQLDRVPKKQAQALTAEIMVYLLNDIFLLGLRAVDISVVNLESILFIPLT